MSTSPGIISKIAAFGGAALGLTMINDNRQLASQESTREEEQMFIDDSIEHMMEKMRDYSGNETLTRIKHRLFEPGNFHFIRRPIIHVKHFIGLLKDNLIPLSLAVIGLTYGCNLSLTGIARNLGISGRFVGKNSWRGVANVSKAVWEVSRPARQYLASCFRMPSVGHKGTLAITSSLGICLYALHRFKCELTGENQEDAFNYFELDHLE